MFCPACGTSAGTHDRFCQQCGKPLPAEGASSAGPPPMPQPIPPPALSYQSAPSLPYGAPPAYGTYAPPAPSWQNMAPLPGVQLASFGAPLARWWQRVGSMVLDVSRIIMLCRPTINSNNSDIWAVGLKRKLEGKSYTCA